MRSSDAASPALRSGAPRERGPRSSSAPRAPRSPRPGAATERRHARRERRGCVARIQQARGRKARPDRTHLAAARRRARRRTARVACEQRSIANTGKRRARVRSRRDRGGEARGKGRARAPPWAPRGIACTAREGHRRTGCATEGANASVHLLRGKAGAADSAGLRRRTRHSTQGKCDAAVPSRHTTPPTRLRGRCVEPRGGTRAAQPLTCVHNAPVCNRPPSPPKRVAREPRPGLFGRQLEESLSPLGRAGPSRRQPRPAPSRHTRIRVH